MGKTVARQNGRLLAIRQLLDHDEICLDIVRYLVSHEAAADTVRGIAEWWINRDVARTAQALKRLQDHGIVRSYLVQDSTSIYAFTKNALLRETLRQLVDTVPRTTPAEPR